MDIAKLLASLDTAWLGRLKQTLVASVQPLPSAGKSRGSIPPTPLPEPPRPQPAPSVRPGSDHGQRAIDCHRTAETHINAALYELDRLRDEVAAVLAKSPDQLLNAAPPLSKSDASRSAQRKPDLAA